MSGRIIIELAERGNGGLIAAYLEGRRIFTGSNVIEQVARELLVRGHKPGTTLIVRDSDGDHVAGTLWELAA